MITKFNQYKLITENPDTIVQDDYDLAFTDSDALPFFVDVNNSHTLIEKIYIGDYGDAHSDICDEEGIEYPGRGVGAQYVAYPGRLWEDSKVMSFWVYPSVNLFKKIIKELEEKLKIKIFNNDWKIEVIKSDYDEIKISKFDPDDEVYLRGEIDDDDNFTGNIDIIPIEEYAGSEDVPEEFQIQHLMNWKEKELAKKLGKIHFGKFGSHKTAWDQPHNIKYRQAIRTSENKSINDNKI